MGKGGQKKKKEEEAEEEEEIKKKKKKEEEEEQQQQQQQQKKKKKKKKQQQQRQLSKHPRSVYNIACHRHSHKPRNGGLLRDRGSNPSDSDTLSTSPPEPQLPPLLARPRPLAAKSDTKGTNSRALSEFSSRRVRLEWRT